MATGDTPDFVNRLKTVLPRWWPDLAAAPVYSGLLQGMASVLAQCYALIGYVRLQTRLLTSTDGWLDLSAYSFFGLGLPRKPSELDVSYRQRIVAALFPERGTRRGMSAALTALTGRVPVVFEPGRAADAFCLGYGGLGTGQLGSTLMNNQAFIVAYRPQGSGANVAGLGSGVAGLGTGYLALPSPATLYGATVDADIYALINTQKPEGSTMWTQISN